MKNNTSVASFLSQLQREYYDSYLFLNLSYSAVLVSGYSVTLFSHLNQFLWVCIVKTKQKNNAIIQNCTVG